MADELDVDAMLEAPYQKEVSMIFNLYSYQSIHLS